MIPFDLSLIHGRVAAGVAWLEDRDPDWFMKEDVERLNIEIQCDCVLGQWDDSGDYDRALKNHDLSPAEAVRLGFLGPVWPRQTGPAGYWDALQAEWVRVIRAKQAARMAKTAPDGV